jgi:hypothetical protein
MVIDLAEHRLNRQLRSAFAATTDHPGPHKSGPVDAMVVLTWKKVSPSAHLMVDPRNGARAVIRDTGANAGRFLWSVLAAGEVNPVSEGRTDDLARAQAIAKAALGAYAEKQLGDAVRRRGVPLRVLGSRPAPMSPSGDPKDPHVRRA